MPDFWILHPTCMLPSQGLCLLGILFLPLFVYVTPVYSLILKGSFSCRTSLTSCPAQTSFYVLHGTHLYLFVCFWLDHLFSQLPVSSMTVGTRPAGSSHTGSPALAQYLAQNGSFICMQRTRDNWEIRFTSSVYLQWVRSRGICPIGTSSLTLVHSVGLSSQATISS